MLNSKLCPSNSKHNTSRHQIIDWINDTLLLNISSIEQLGTGAVYCQLLDSVFPQRVPLYKVNWKARLPYEIISNYKILQAAFHHLGIEKEFDVERLSKCKSSSNWEAIQWFKHFVDEHGGPSEDYNPVMRRKNAEVDLRFSLVNSKIFQDKGKQNRERNSSVGVKSLIPSINIRSSTERPYNLFRGVSTNRTESSKTYSISNFTTIRTMYTLADVPFIQEVDQ